MIESRITSITVLPEGESLFSEKATVITIVDEAGGEFVEARQTDSNSDATLRLDPEEWPAIREAIDKMIGSCRPTV